MNITIKKAQEESIPELFKMNKQLIEDEQFDRPLTDEKLMKRWEEFINGDQFNVMLFMVENSVAGYAIVEMDKTPLYLRHFFINSNFRRKGIGSKCFYEMLNDVNATEIDLDVMSWNERGYGFWKSLGFTERCKLMTFKKAT